MPLLLVIGFRMKFYRICVFSTLFLCRSCCILAQRRQLYQGNTSNSFRSTRNKKSRLSTNNLQVQKIMFLPNYKKRALSHVRWSVRIYNEHVISYITSSVFYICSQSFCYVISLIVYAYHTMH